MKTNLTISLPAMHFYAYHGALPQERIVGGHYDVALTVTVANADRALYADALEGTVNYTELYALVAETMARPSSLMEHVAAHLLRRLFQSFHNITTAEVVIVKRTPPIDGDTGPAEVHLTADNPWARPLHLVVLDFDGTIADTAAGIVNTMNATFDELSLVRPDANAVRRTIGLPLYKSIACLTGNEDDTFLNYAVGVYHRLFEKIASPYVKVYPGVTDTLRQLKEAGIILSVATSRGHHSVVNLCREIGISSYIDKYVAVEDVREPKPSPEAVQTICEEFDVPTSETLVVGDTTFDIEMGRYAGAVTCGVGYGNHTTDELFTAGADAVVNAFSDLFKLILSPALSAS